MIISFIGNSDSLGADEEKEEERLLSLLSETVGDKECSFYLGNYGWFDGFASRVCRKYADTHKNCKLILVIPYLDRKYNTERYDETLYPPLETVPKRLAIVRRNEYMIDVADLLIVHVSYIRYARNYLFYAEKKKKKVINIAEKKIGT